MIKHPRQREMWEGLTGTGCAGILLLFFIAAVVGVLASV